MHRLLIIADDLTGAADCGVAGASYGLTSVVVLGEAEGETDTDVLAIDANTRRLNAKDAAAETARLVRMYMPGSKCLLFKKLDSTLRGNVAAELAAVLSTRREIAGDRTRIVALLAPAFPAAGRTTANGRQLIHGRPLEDSDSTQCERPRCRSNIPEILRDEGMSSALIDIATVRSGTRSLRTAISRVAEEVDVIVCDGETNHDLQEIAIASMVLGPGTVWAGSAGLAHHLPRAAGFAFARVSIPDQPLASGPTLFVVGSRSYTSREQVALLAASPNILTISVSNQILIEGASSELWQEHKLAMTELLNSGRDVVVLPVSEHSIESNDVPLLSAALAQLVAPCSQSVGALVATGGETARAVLDAWRVSRLHLIGELEAGLPLSLAENGNRWLPILTKAGSFGTSQTLIHCWQFLRELNRSSTADLYRGQGA